MPTYTEHMLIAFGGTWYAEAADGWECTLRVSSDGGGGGVLNEDLYLNDIVPNLKTWFNTARNGLSNQAQLTYVKCNRIGADGRYIDKSITHRKDFTAVLGGAPSYGPAFLSICTTLHTAALRGRGHMGRIYLPNNTKPMSTSLQISAGDALAVAQSTRRLLQLIKNPVAAPSGWTPDAWAAGSSSVSPTPGIYSGVDASVHVITATSADTVYDVQRRRKEQIKGTRSAQQVI